MSEDYGREFLFSDRCKISTIVQEMSMLGRFQSGKWIMDYGIFRLGPTLRQIGAEMVQDSRATKGGGAAGCKIKGRVGADSISFADQRGGKWRGSLGVGFENMKRSRVMK